MTSKKMEVFLRGAAHATWALVLGGATFAIGCSDLDPSVGARRLEIEGTSDAATGDDGASDDDSAIDPDGISFARDIRPLINRPGKDDPTGRGCKSCHYSTENSHAGLDLGGLDMVTLGKIRKGGGSSGTRIIVPGKPNESILVQVLKGQYPYAARMPKNGNPYWSDEEIKLVYDWIAQGAKGADAE